MTRAERLRILRTRFPVHEGDLVFRGESNSHRSFSTTAAMVEYPQDRDSSCLHGDPHLQGLAVTRADRLRILAWSLPDTLPAPTITRSHAIPGETPDSWKECPVCNGAKKVRGNVCGECRGAGRFKADSYTDARVSGEGSVSDPRTRSCVCDRCNGSGTIPGRYVAKEGLQRCESCEGTGKLDVPIVRLSSEEREHSPPPPSNSYDALYAAIGKWPRSLCIPRYLDWAQDLLPEKHEDVAWGEFLLLDAMPLQITVPKGVVTAWHAREERKNLKEVSRRLRVSGDRQSRRRRILQMFMEGTSASEIAAALHVHASTVRRVIAREN